MEIETGTDQLLLISRSGTGHVLKFDMTFGILSKRPESEIWFSIQNLKEFSCVSYKQYIYILGGYSVKLKRPIQNVKRYDIITKEWTDLANMENERRLCTAAVFNDEIIICGGFKNTTKLLNSTEIYNISRNKWRKGPSFKKPIADIQLVIVNDSILGFGGIKNSVYNDDIILCGNDEIYEYKDSYKEWTLLDENVPLVMGKPVYSHSVVEMESKIYIIGGLKTVVQSDGEINEVINSKVESLFIDENQLKILETNNLKDWISPWDRSLPSPNISRSGAAAICIGSDIYYFGGTDEHHSTSILDVEKFNAKRCRWNKEFTIKYEVDLSLVTALIISGSQFKSRRTNREIIPETKVPDEVNNEKITESNTAIEMKMYKVGWVLW